MRSERHSERTQNSELPRADGAKARMRRSFAVAAPAPNDAGEGEGLLLGRFAPAAASEVSSSTCLTAMIYRFCRYVACGR